MFLPSGVADAAERTGYVADAAGRIDAIALLTGEPLWQTAGDARPVIVVEHRLATLRRGDASNQLRIEVLDTRAGGDRLIVSDPIVFPDWVSATTTGGESFQYRVTCEDTDLLLEWEAHAHYRGGAAPSPQVRATATKDASGIARVGLDSGRVAMLPSERPRDPKIPDAVQQALTFSYQSGSAGVWHTDPWEVDDKLAAITGDIAGEHQTLHLQRWNPATGAIDRPITLVTGVALVCYVTGDGSCLLIHSEQVSANQKAGRSPWWVFSVASGKQIATLTYEPGAREPSNIGSRLYFVVDAPASGGDAGSLVPSTMRSVDLPSGALIWERPLTPRETRARPALRQ